MVILRRTRKLAARLPESPAISGQSDTALGDWYVNRTTVDRRPLLLLVSSTSLLAVVVPAREVKALPRRLPTLVRARLERSGIEPRAIDAERRVMGQVMVGPTADRSVVGIMVDFGKMLQDLLGGRQWTEDDLPLAEDFLARNPCFAGRPDDEVVFPVDAAPKLLRAKWLAGSS